MAAPQAKKKSAPGRNDPCHCGSGRKYKECHLPIEEGQRREQRLLREAQEGLIQRIVSASQEFPAAFPDALERFWEGKYAPTAIAELDEHEDRGSERFLVWFAFDYPLEDGRTLVERLADQAAAGELDVEAPERSLLGQWRAVRLRAYRVEERKKGQWLRLHDLLDGSELRVVDVHASRRLEAGEVVVCHLAPTDRDLERDEPNYYFVGAAAQLTPDTAETLVQFAELHLADLRRSEPEATWADLVRQRSYVLNHFVNALPSEANDPSVLDKILAEGRAGLTLTIESVNQLLGRPTAAPEAKAEDEGAEPETKA